MTTDKTQAEVFEIRSIIRFGAQDAMDILTTAVEGGCNYWAVGQNIKRDSDLNVVEFDIRDAEDPDDPWHHVHYRDVAKALEAILADGGETCKCRGIASQFFGTPENWYYDADGADAVVQIIAYGEVIFG